MTNDSIVIRGARQHNLKNLTLKSAQSGSWSSTGLSGSENPPGF